MPRFDVLINTKEHDATPKARMSVFDGSRWFLVYFAEGMGFIEKYYPYWGA